MAKSVREPAVAGSFYPASEQALRSSVREFLNQADAKDTRGTLKAPKAIVAPHAGYKYSGPIAGSVYATLKSARTTIRRVVLLGPSHRVALEGLAVPTCEAFQTPLGAIPLDRAAIKQVLTLPQVQELDQAHAAEHSLEVHLPFLQEVLEEFQLIPLVVGESKPQEVAQVLDLLWGGPETLIVVSSDLSHYHDYQTARKLDQATSKAIEELRYQDIDYDHACGRNPLGGLLYVARQRGLHGTTIDLRNSGDTAGSRDEVVGYGAYAFE